MLVRLLKNKSVLAVGDQVLLSAASFITAYVLVAVAGVEIFGVYSFMLVVGLLLHSTFLSLLHGQMILRISGARKRIQNSFFKCTFYLFVFSYTVLSVLIVIFIYYQNWFDSVHDYSNEIIAALFYTFLLTIFELFRRFLYSLNRQDLSFICTLIYVSMLVVGLAWMYFNAGAENAIVSVYAIYSFSLILGIMINRLCIGILINAKRQPLKTVTSLFKSYFSQGRFAFMGMLVVWFQNQSVTPIMMVIAGPAAVGYFNIARLITVPVIVVNTGITNSTLPKFRAQFKLDKFKEIFKQIRKYALINLSIVVVYAIVLFVFHQGGLLGKLVPGYEHVAGFLIAWMVVCMALVFRVWLTQYLAVSMQFRYLFITGVIAAVVTLSTMLLVHLVTGNQYLIPVCVLIGEIYLISQFYTKCVKECA